MTPQRYEHYRTALSIIEDLGASKLHPNERAILTDCAEDLLLGVDVRQTESRRAEAIGLLNQLVLSGRWLAPTAGRLAAHIEACGPAELIAA